MGEGSLCSAGREGGEGGSHPWLQGKEGEMQTAKPSVKATPLQPLIP